MLEELGEEVLRVVGAVIARRVVTQQAEILLQHPVNRPGCEVRRIGHKVRFVPMAVPASAHQQRFARSRLFFFDDTATNEIYTLSLHDALPISAAACSASRSRQSSITKVACARSRRFTCPAPSSTCCQARCRCSPAPRARISPPFPLAPRRRSEEHTSELQSRLHLVCRLLLEKK